MFVAKIKRIKNLFEDNAEIFQKKNLSNKTYAFGIIHFGKLQFIRFLQKIVNFYYIKTLQFDI